jgi:hypothetical protein
MNRTYWASLVDRFIKDLGDYNYFDRSLDVRENIKFKGGHFSNWLHENFSPQVCCMSIEFKKFFMDEWTGKPEEKHITEIYTMLQSTLPGIINELKKLSESNR